MNKIIRLLVSEHQIVCEQTNCNINNVFYNCKWISGFIEMLQFICFPVRILRNHLYVQITYTRYRY